MSRSFYDINRRSVAIVYNSANFKTLHFVWFPCWWIRFAPDFIARRENVLKMAQLANNFLAILKRYVYIYGSLCIGGSS